MRGVIHWKKWENVLNVVFIHKTDSSLLSKNVWFILRAIVLLFTDVKSGKDFSFVEVRNLM